MVASVCVWQARQRPPLGSGNGFCPRSLFIRLFQGTRQRVARQEPETSDQSAHIYDLSMVGPLGAPNKPFILEPATQGRGQTKHVLAFCHQ